MTPAQKSYLIDAVLGFVGAGLLVVSEQTLNGGTPDWRALGAAFLGGGIAWLRKYLHANYGIEQTPPPVIVSLGPTPPPPHG